jgi:hypothetical protein
VADWETARAIAGSFPGAEESTSYGQPAFKVRKRLFAWLSPDRAADGALATYVDEAEKELIDSRSELGPADSAVLRERIEDSWLLRAPKTLVDAYMAGAG